MIDVRDEIGGVWSTVIDGEYVGHTDLVQFLAHLVVLGYVDEPIVCSHGEFASVRAALADALGPNDFWGVQGKSRRKRRK